MQLYTLVLDYAGGTYVSQLEALDETTALRDCILKLKARKTSDTIPVEVASAFEASTDDLVLVNGLSAVWCASAIATHGLALVNLVKTSR